MMQTTDFPDTIAAPDNAGLSAADMEEAALRAAEQAEATLPPSVAVRCGPAETAAIIRLLDGLEAARAAAQAWDGITRDRHQRVRQKYTVLLADLFQRHPDQVLAGLKSPQAHTRIWIALTVMQAPSMRAMPALKEAIAAEQDERARLALARALLACKGMASSLAAG